MFRSCITIIFLLLCTPVRADHVGGIRRAASRSGIGLFPEENLSPKNQSLFASAFCENPVTAICGTFRVAKFDELLTRTKDDYRAAATKFVTEKYGQHRMHEVMPTVKSLSKTLAQIREFGPSMTTDVVENLRAFGVDRSAIALFRFLEQKASKELSENLSMKQSSLLMNKLRPALQAAIASSPAPRGSDRNELNELAGQALSDVRFFTPADYLEAGGSISAIRAFCGLDFISNNAFFIRPANQRENSFTSVVVCPGVWLSAIAAKRNGHFSDSYLTDTLVPTLAHELGHRIDFRRTQTRTATKGIYRDFSKCVHEQFVKKGTLEEFQNDDFNEISADYWSAETLAQLVTTNRASRTDILRMLRYWAEPHCDSNPAPEDPHPMGRLRINLMAHNPRLWGVLCPDRPELNGPICSIEGHANPPPITPNRPNLR